MEIRILLVKFVVQTDLGIDAPSPIGLFSSAWNWKGTFLTGNLCPAFRQEKEGPRTFPASAVFQLPSAQNNHYDKAAYFGGGIFQPPSSFWLQRVPFAEESGSA